MEGCSDTPLGASEWGEVVCGFSCPGVLLPRGLIPGGWREDGIAGCLGCSRVVLGGWVCVCVGTLLLLPLCITRMSHLRSRAEGLCMYSHGL